LTIYKISRFLVANNSYDFINGISQRNGNFDRYCSLKNGFDRDLKHRCSTNKFSAINTHGNRYEFRLFKGNLRIDRILKNIEFIVALKYYFDNLELFKVGTVNDFKKFIDLHKKEYKNLDSFIKERGL
jgi:hypothetical protein